MKIGHLLSEKFPKIKNNNMQNPNNQHWKIYIYIYVLEGMWYGKGGQAECEAAHWEGTPAIELDHSTFVKVCNFFRKECILILYSGQPMAIFSFAGSFIDNTDFYSSTRAIYRRLFKIKQLLFLQRNQSSHLKGHLGPHVSDRKGCVYVSWAPKARSETLRIPQNEPDWAVSWPHLRISSS